jgi:hypothetical protein
MVKRHSAIGLQQIPCMGRDIWQINGQANGIVLLLWCFLQTHFYHCRYAGLDTNSRFHLTKEIERIVSIVDDVF